MRMLSAMGLGEPKNQQAIRELQIQVEFIKQGLHALAEWRIRHREVSRATIVDAVASMIRHGLQQWNPE